MAELPPVRFARELDRYRKLTEEFLTSIENQVDDDTEESEPPDDEESEPTDDQPEIPNEQQAPTASNPTVQRIIPPGSQLTAIARPKGRPTEKTDMKNVRFNQTQVAKRKSIADLP